METANFDSIIESLEVYYYQAGMREVFIPVFLNNTKEQKSILVQSVKGSFYAGKENKLLKNNSFYFIPAGQAIYFKHGKSNNYKVFTNEGFQSPVERENFLKKLSAMDENKKAKDIFSIAGFNVRMHGAIPFFQMLEVPCMHIPYDEELSYLLQSLVMEEEMRRLGRHTLIKCYLKEIVIHICRYMYSRPEYKTNIDKLNYLLDKRLINIIQYIQENLDKDLSNEKVAEVAFVSKDYVGHFFKTLTDGTLQDYIENRRLERAHLLLRTTNDNVQEIAHKVGFKDSAYFSRRFKMRYGENAKEIRKSTQFIV